MWALSPPLHGLLSVEPSPLVQANRKAYAEDSQTIIRRQRAAIEKLQMDNTSMKRELDVAAVVRPHCTTLLTVAAPPPGGADARAPCPGGRWGAELERAAGNPAPARDGGAVHPQGEQWSSQPTLRRRTQRMTPLPLPLTLQIEAEKKRVSQLDEQIRAYDAKALQKRKVMGGAHPTSVPLLLHMHDSDASCCPSDRCAGVNAAKDDTQAVAKQIKLLENKLEAALIKLNEAVGRNKVLRENIDHLRRERVTFDQVSVCAADCLNAPPADWTGHRCTAKSSATCTTRSGRCPTSSTSPTWRARRGTRPETRLLPCAPRTTKSKPLSTPSSERWVMMLAAAVASPVAHAQPSSCPAFRLAASSRRTARPATPPCVPRLRKSTSTGSKRTRSAKRHGRRAARCSACPHSPVLTAHLCVPQASKGHWQAAREKKEKEAPPPTPVVNSDEALARIQAATGITRIEDLVEAFVTAEDQSFSMFNFVNELNQEAERLEEQAVALHQELDKSTGGEEDSVRSRMARVRAMSSVGLHLVSVPTDQRLCRDCTTSWRLWSRGLRPWMPSTCQSPPRWTR